MDKLSAESSKKNYLNKPHKNRLQRVLPAKARYTPRKMAVFVWLTYRIFVFDSFSCRIGKGTHKTQTCWILKCDIRKFFENIDHEILLAILKEYIPDKNII